MPTVNTEKLEGSMVLLWIDGALFVAPVAMDSLPMFVPMLAAFQGHTDDKTPTTILRLGAEEAKVANLLAAQITAKATGKGKRK